MLEELTLLLRDVMQLASHVSLSTQQASAEAICSELSATAPRLQHALSALQPASVQSAGPDVWTPAAQAVFGEWLARSYPNVASAGTIALG